MNEPNSTSASSTAAAAESVTGAGSAATASDPKMPTTGEQVPLAGIEPGKDVPFMDQVKGNAKMMAGKVFGNDKEVQQGAAV